MDREGTYCFHLSSEGSFHEKRRDHRAGACIVKGFAERRRVGYAHADVFHQSGGQGTDCEPPSGTPEGQEDSFRANP